MSNLNMEGVKWIVVTTHSVRTFTSTEYMTSYVKKRENIILSIAHVTERK